MDNLTHTLAGLLMAEAAVALRARKGSEASRSWRTAAYLTSAVVHNLPDFDFLYTGITGGSLGYLLHHRGHSHTVVVASALGLLALAVVAVVARRRKFGWSRSDFGWLFGLCWFGPLVHIAMDFTNNYGVHPFWPLYDGWIYGDAIFIVEPYFWAIGIPPLIFAAEARTTKSIYALFLVLGVGLCWLVSVKDSPWGVRLIPPPMALGVT
ncbi:MAG TPA: metal-dependent hydrolase, partial [Polyangiaceae bacterium]